MPGLTLRPATSSDIPDVLAFWREAAEDAHRPADSAPAVEALIARDPGALILALDDATVVGNELAHNAWRACGYAAQSEWSRWIKPLPARAAEAAV